MKIVKTNKIFPYCYNFIIFSIFFIFPLFIILGILFIRGSSISIALVISGVLLIVLPMIFVPLFYSWLRSLLVIEFKDSYLIYNDILIITGILHRRLEEISLVDLCTLIVENGKTFNLIYKNGTKKLINLNSFSKKQRIIIKLEILKKACHINGYAVKENNY